MATADTKAADDAIDEHTKPPFLRRVRIRGYKSIAFCDVALEPLTVLVGRNAAGKSNFLDALAFLRDAISYNPLEAIRRHGGIQAIACRSARMDSIQLEFEVGFTYESEFVAHYSLTFTPEGLSAPPEITESMQFRDIIKNEVCSFTSSQGTARWTGPPFDGRRLHVPPNQLVLSIIGELPFTEMGDGLRWIGIHNFQPDAIRQHQPPSPGSLLVRDGTNLASVIEILSENEPNLLKRVQGYLSLIAPEVRGFQRVGYGEYETIRFAMCAGTEDEKLEFDAASMSDGTLRVLASLMAASQVVLPYGHPSVIGIEEPETALHPAAMHVLVDALRDATQHTQILITTHSAELLDDRHLDPSQVLVVRNRNGETIIGPVGPAGKEIVEKELYTLADLHRMDHLDPDEANVAEQAKNSNGKHET